MNRLKVISICMSGTLLIGSLSMAQKSMRNDKNADLLIAKGKSFEITLGEFIDVASAQSSAAQHELISNANNREQMLEKLINMNLLAAEASRRGYDKNPEVIAVKKNRLAALMHTTIAEQIDEVEPTEADLQAFYKANFSKYNKPEKIRARHILISDKKTALELLNQLKKDGGGQYQFRKYAKEKSEDKSTAARGGDLAFFTRDDIDGNPDPKIIEAAYQIPENGGLFPHLVETDKGYHIVMRTGYRKAIDLKFEDARERIVKLVQRQIHRDKVDRAMADLQKKYPVKLFEENLKHVVIDLTKPATGPAPGIAQDPIR